jgi:pilus assembly protein CpaC
MKRFFTILGATALLGLATAAPLAAQPQVTGEAQASRSIALQVGETRLLRLSEKVIRISVADPDVADVQVVTPLQVLITAKSVGNTHLMLWGTQDEPLVMSVHTVRNLDQLRAQLGKLFPNEAIEVSSAGELVVLSGQVSDLRLPARAAEVAQLYSQQLANLIEVKGDQQVQLEVRFAEVSRSALRRIGMDFLWRDAARGYVGGQAIPGSVPGQYLNGSKSLHIPGTGAGAGPPLVHAAPAATDAFNLFFSTGLSDFPFSAILSILSQEGLARVLAEPTLVALSGQSAKFHAGGEVPIVHVAKLGELSVEFKKFGVKLDFSPTVLGARTISLKLAVEVSEPDPNNGIAMSGITIPGFRSRSSETTIRIKDGQSFAVAGLLSDDVRSTVSKVPLLGDLPILGMLFRSQAYQREETELMVVVTAHLVRPVQASDLPPLPGEDELNDPGDLEFFLLGNTTPGRSTPRPASQAMSRKRGGATGPVGFARNF